MIEDCLHGYTVLRASRDLRAEAPWWEALSDGSNEWSMDEFTECAEGEGSLGVDSS